MRVIETIGNIEWVKSGTLGGITEQKVRVDWLESSNKNQKAPGPRATRHHKIKSTRAKCGDGAKMEGKIKQAAGHV
jgi:hypothetical protein